MSLADEIENDARGSRRSLGNPDSLDARVADLPRGHTVSIDPRTCAQNVEVKPVGIVSAVCVKFGWSRGFNDDARGTGVRKGANARNLNYAGIRCGDHGQE